MLRRLVFSLPVLAIGWLAVLAGVMAIDGTAPAAFVPFPSAELLANLPQDAAITGRSTLSITLRSEAPGLTARLYGAGAWLVLPAGLEACIPGFLRET